METEYLLFHRIPYISSGIFTFTLKIEYSSKKKNMFYKIDSLYNWNTQHIA